MRAYEPSILDSQERDERPDGHFRLAPEPPDR
jgi:hypothetical protein